MVKNKQAAGGTKNRIRLRTASVLVAALVVLGLGGCYWTGGAEQEAGLVLEITRSRDGVITSQEIVDEYGFLFAYVIEESVLLQGPEAVEDLFVRLDEELETLFSEEFLELFFEEDEAAIEQFLADFRFDIEFPSAQFQGQFITFQRGASGRNTFRGLNSGARYLVVVEAFGEDDRAGIDADAIGFALTSVRAGETRSVALNLDDSRDDFDDFIRDQYGFERVEEEELADLEPATIEIFGLGDNPYYFELLLPDVPDFSSIFAFTVISNLPPQDFQDWYDNGAVMPHNVSGTVQAKSGNRDTLQEFDYYHIIEGVKPGQTWRLLITRWPDRESTPNAPADPWGPEGWGSEHSLLSSPFTFEPGEEILLDKMSDFDGFNTISS